MKSIIIIKIIIFNLVYKLNYINFCNKKTNKIKFKRINQILKKHIYKKNLKHKTNINEREKKKKKNQNYHK